MSQNNNKSTGPDQLIAEVFKVTFDIMSPLLGHIFNKIFETGHYSESWSNGIIIQIFKDDNIDEPQNYRGITLNNILAKIYSTLLSNRLSTWTIKHKTIIDNQFGLQKEIQKIYSPIVNIQNISGKEKLYVAVLDWEKMFDNINRSFLWQQLAFLNISSTFISTIKSMYNIVKQVIRYKSDTSESIPSFMGVKQGDPRSSLLCLLFLNDILENINADSRWHYVR